MRDRSENPLSWHGKSWESATFRVFCCVLILVATNAQAVQAQEVVVQNDSLVEQACAAVQAGFREGDIGAAVFDLAPNLYPVEIKAVQVYWQSQSPLMQGLTHIHVYGNGGPDPGPPIYTGTSVIRDSHQLIGSVIRDSHQLIVRGSLRALHRLGGGAVRSLHFFWQEALRANS